MPSLYVFADEVQRAKLTRLASVGIWPNLLHMETPDQFRELFRMQKALNERIGVHTDAMSEPDKTK